MQLIESYIIIPYLYVSISHLANLQVNDNTVKKEKTSIRYDFIVYVFKSYLLKRLRTFPFSRYNRDGLNNVVIFSLELPTDKSSSVDRSQSSVNFNTLFNQILLMCISYENKSSFSLIVKGRLFN